MSMVLVCNPDAINLSKTLAFDTAHLCKSLVAVVTDISKLIISIIRFYLGEL